MQFRNIVGFLSFLQILSSVSAVNAGTTDAIYMDGNNLWQRHKNDATQITFHKCRIDQWKPSPDKTLIVYHLSSYAIGRLFLIDADGNLIRKIAQTKNNESPKFNAISSLQWIDEKRIGAEYHINPSCSEYVVSSPITGTVIGDHYGFNFSWSPDKTKLAQVGFMPHFADPGFKSYRLEVNGKQLYPAVTSPTKGAEKPVKTKSDSSSLFAPFSANTHEFLSNFAWCADSKSLAFVDSANKKINVVVVDIAPSKNLLIQLPKNVISIQSIAWKNANEIAVNTNGGNFIVNRVSKSVSAN